MNYIDDDTRSVRSLALTERKSIKNYNRSLDKKINDTIDQLKNAKVLSKKGLANDNL